MRLARITRPVRAQINAGPTAFAFNRVMMLSNEIERLAARVRAAARDDGLIETAQVKLLGLDEVRAAAGARWPRMREYVREGSLKIIADRLGPDDAVISCGDGFLVVFADAAGEQALARAKAIEEALIAFYLGEEALKALRAEVENDVVDAGQLYGLVGGAPDTQIDARRNDLNLGRFWPVWSARHMAVAAYLCGPVMEDAGGRRLGYNPSFLEKGAHGVVDYLDLDLCLLEQACANAEHESAAAVGVCVHATTLQTRRNRQTYLEHLADNTQSVQQRMFITIAEIEPGTPLMSLTEWTRTLQRHVPRIALEFHSSDRAIGAIGSTGAWAAGYHLPSYPVGSAAKARAELCRIDNWCRSLSRQGLQPFIGGFREAGLLDLASYSDLSFATGEQLWSSRTAPAGVRLATVRRDPRLAMAA